MVLHNPWDVSNASIFLNYCCPECDHKSKTLSNFAQHSLENHELSKVLFDQSDHDMVKDETSVKDEPVIMIEDVELFKDENAEQEDIPSDLDDNDYVKDETNPSDNDEEYIPKKKKSTRPKRSVRVNVNCKDSDVNNRKKKRHKNLGKPGNDGWISCEHCPEKKFLFTFELLEHMTDFHTGVQYATYPLTTEELIAKDVKLAESKFKCAMCDNPSEYQYKSQLIKHWLDTHGKNDYVYDACQWCMEVFHTWDSILLHHEQVHPTLPKRWYPCIVTECFFNGTELSRLYKHFKKHKDAVYSSPLKCSLCDQAFIIEECLLSHMKEVHSHDLQTFECPECPMVFLSESLKLIHQSMHGNNDDVDKKFLCKYCLDVCLTRHDLVNHHKDNHEFQNLPFFLCDKCDYFSTKSTDTEEHYKSAHGIDKYFPFECRNCDHVNAKLNSFQFHLITHKDVSHVCHECGTKLKNKNFLRRHIEYHHKKDDRCVCDICGFSTTHKDWLRRHMKTHGGAKRLPCPHCEKDFRDKSTLEVHLDHNHSVEEEKKFFCQQCGRGFMYRYSLTNHVHKHKQWAQKKLIKKIPEAKDLTPTKCPHCDKVLRGECNVRRHITQSHKETVCPHCKKSDLNKFQLKKHMYFEHGKNEGAIFCHLCSDKVFFTKLAHTKHLQKVHSL